MKNQKKQKQLSQKKRNKKSGEELAKVLWYYNLIPNTITLKQKIVCPFHDDMNPSMVIDLEEGSFYCFGCGLSGDALAFVKLIENKYHNLNELQACRKFVKILKSNKVSNIKLNAPKIKNKPLQRQLYDEAYDYYHGLKRTAWGALNAETEQEAVQASEYMHKRGFTDKALLKAKAKITYQHDYSLIFPMLDNGIFKGWVCRTMIKEIESRRKYLYNKGFSRATTLVGNYGSKDYVFVVEGYMDRLKFVQFGEENVVAILGWKMSAQQMQKLKDKGITKIICALDNDECGRRGYRYLKKYFEVTRFRYLKGIKDVGEMTKEQFEKCLNKTMQDFRNNK